MSHYYRVYPGKNWELALSWYLTDWALPLRISGWYTRNNDPEIKAEGYEWFNKPDGNITIHILFLTLRLDYDSLGIEQY